MNIESLFFEQFQLPFRVTLGLLLGIITLPGFFILEHFREKQIKKTELAKKQGLQPTLYMHQGPGGAFMLLYGYAFNYMILTFAFAVGMSRPYLFATARLCFAPQVISTQLKLSNTKFFSLLTHKYAFGVRGCIVANG